MTDTFEQLAYRLLAPPFRAHRRTLTALQVQAGDMVVENGVFTPTYTPAYTAVPLTFIESGEVTIIENGKAIKHLGKGECFGLFETAHFLGGGSSKRIGRWHVRAVSDARLCIASADFLQQLPEHTKQALMTAAINNAAPKPITSLPILDWFASAYNVHPLDDIAIVYHSHVLPSSHELLKHLAYLAGPNNTFVLEKPYSTIPYAFRKVTESGIHTYQMHVDTRMPYEHSIRKSIDYFLQDVLNHVQHQGIAKVVVISDGGDILLSPVLREFGNVSIIGIEQTERGVRRIAQAGLPYPIVTIGNTATKKIYESPFIAKAAMSKIKSLCYIRPGLTYGILGAGAIGRALIGSLNHQGIIPLVYDPIEGHAGSSAISLERLVQSADVVIGATGTDCLHGMYLERLKGEKTFISVSSSNIEFAYLFNLARTYANSFEEIVLPISDKFSATILNGGYPINFDREAEWEIPEDIQLTRALIYAAVHQALTMPGSGSVAKLHADFEEIIARRWLEG